MPKVKRRDEKKKELEQLRDSVEALHRRVDEVFDLAEIAPSRLRPLWDGDACCLEALGEVQETDTELIVTVDLPMVNKEDIEVTVTETQVGIHAKTRNEIRFERWGTVQRQIRFQSFSKTVQLPPGLDPSKIRATFQDGILTVRIPKIHKRQHIPIE